jgi:hypothetical protein
MFTAFKNKPAIINFIRAMVELSKARLAEPQRWQERFDDIPRIVHGLTEQQQPPLQPIITLDDWLTRDLPQADFIMGNWLTTTSRNILSADTGIGKTLMAMALGLRASAALPFLHWDARRAIRVLYVDGEMPRRLMQKRLQDEVARLGIVMPPGFHMLSHEDIKDIADNRWQPLNMVEGQKLIEEQIARVGGVDLIILDNIMSLIAGDQKDEEGWRQVLPWVFSLTRRRIAQLWLHHTGHDASRGYGTKVREWQMDNVIHLDAVGREDTDVSFLLRFTKAREREPATRKDFRDVKIALVGNEWSYEAASGVTPGKISPLARKFYDVLCIATRNSDLNHNGSPAATLEQWQADLIKSGLIDNDAKPNSQRALLSKYKIQLITANWIGSNERLAWTLASNQYAVF